MAAKQQKNVKNLLNTSFKQMHWYVFFVVVVDYPTPSEEWGHGEDHGAPEAGKLPRVWTRGRTETESRQSERRKVHSWTVQNEMRGALGRVSTSAAGSIFDSANPSKIKT